MEDRDSDAREVKKVASYFAPAWKACGRIAGPTSAELHYTVFFANPRSAKTRDLVELYYASQYHEHLAPSWPSLARKFGGLGDIDYSVAKPAQDATEAIATLDAALARSPRRVEVRLKARQAFNALESWEPYLARRQLTAFLGQLDLDETDRSSLWALIDNVIPPSDETNAQAFSDASRRAWGVAFAGSTQTDWGMLFQALQEAGTNAARLGRTDIERWQNAAAFAKAALDPIDWRAADAPTLAILRAARPRDDVFNEASVVARMTILHETVRALLLAGYKRRAIEALLHPHASEMALQTWFALLRASAAAFVGEKPQRHLLRAEQTAPMGHIPPVAAILDMLSHWPANWIIALGVWLYARRTMKPEFRSAVYWLAANVVSTSMDIEPVERDAEALRWIRRAQQEGGRGSEIFKRCEADLDHALSAAAIRRQVSVETSAILRL